MLSLSKLLLLVMPLKRRVIIIIIKKNEKERMTRINFLFPFYVYKKKLLIRVQYIDQIGAVESVKAASDIYTPITGEVVNINEALGDEPSLINSSPEEDGKFSKKKMMQDKRFCKVLRGRGKGG